MQLGHSFLVSVPVNRNSTVLYFQYDSVCNTCEQEILTDPYTGSWCPTFTGGL